MRIAIYVRVSTQRQAQTQTIEQQIDRLRAHLQAQGWPLPEGDIFRDDGYSGTSLKRPGLDRLRDRAAMASFDKIFITDPDRLARNYVHQVLLLEELQKHGCRVEFLDRPMSQDPHDQLLLQIRGAVAEYERTLIAERMRRGRQRQFQAGKMLPWTRAPYGYRMAADRPRDPSGVYQDPAEAAVVAEIFAWYLEGRHTLHGLVDHLHELGVRSPSGKPHWSGPSVRGILRNPVYTGRVYANRTRCRAAQIRRSATHPIGRPQGTATPLPEREWIEVGTVPAVITREQFDLVQAKLATNQSFSARNNKVGTYLLRSLVSCGGCGLACLARRLPPRNSYYVCTGKTRAARHRNGATCESRYIPSRAIDDLVWQDLCDLLRHPAAVAEAFRLASVGAWHPQEFQARRERLRQGKASLAQQLERLTEAYLGGVIPLPEYERRRAEIGVRDASLAEQERRLCGEADRLNETLGLAASLEAFRKRVSTGLETATFDQKRQLVELLIDRVVVTGDEIEIRYVLPTSPQSEHVRFCHLRLDYFHRPADRQLHPALLPLRTPDDLQVPPGVGFHPLVEREVVILAVGEHPRHLAHRLALEPGEQLRRRPRVVDIGGRHQHGQQQAHAVHDDMPFPTVDVLGVVAAPLLTAGTGVDRLAVDTGGRPGMVRLLGGPGLAAEPVVDGVQDAPATPSVEVPPDGALGREVLGQIPPLAAGSEDVEDGVEDVAHVGGTRPPAGWGGREVGLDQGPLLVGEVTRVVVVWHTTSTPLEAPVFPL
jgi:site-specific DNA recombinase